MVPLSLTRSLTLFRFLTFFPHPLSWLCELVRVSVLFSTLFPPFSFLFFLTLSLFCRSSQTEHAPHTLRSGTKRTPLTRDTPIRLRTRAVSQEVGKSCPTTLRCTGHNKSPLWTQISSTVNLLPILMPSILIGM